MIVATAGHIDHGKTLLVKALTGVDADRLPEEKARGMTIDLGFAYVPGPDGSVIGFVDVPGHERFVRNMVAGVTGIDFALLIVAADDGPMPQTEEHLAILDLIGVDDGAVALTKIDRVDPSRLAEVTEDIHILTMGTVLEGAPLFPVSGLTGDGVPALSTALEAAARRWQDRTSPGRFRLAIDRCFVLKGAGVVVTGTVFSGAVAVEDEVLLSPRGLKARVRRLHAQNRAADRGGRGQRLALNIAGPGLARDRVRRGDWLVAPAAGEGTRRIDARLRLLRSEPRPLSHWTSVHVHLGAADITGRVALLEGRRVAPGDSALVQIVLDEPTCARHGDRFILRDRSAQRTMAGGQVIDPFAPARGRRRPQRLAVVRALEAADPVAALTGLLTVSPNGVDLEAFAGARNLTTDEATALFAAVPLVRSGARGFDQVRWRDLGKRVVAAVDADTSDDGRGLAEGDLRTSLGADVSPVELEAVLGSLAGDGAVERAGGFVRPPGRKATLSKADASLWSRVQPLLLAGGTRAARVHELAESLRMPPGEVERFLIRAAGQGLLKRVAKNRFFPPAALADLAAAAEALAGENGDGQFDARAYRDRTGIGRNLAIEVLEFFDAQGFTKRRGDGRQVVRPAASMFPRP